MKEMDDIAILFQYSRTIRELDLRNNPICKAVPKCVQRRRPDRCASGTMGSCAAAQLRSAPSFRALAVLRRLAPAVRCLTHRVLALSLSPLVHCDGAMRRANEQIP